MVGAPTGEAVGAVGCEGAVGIDIVGAPTGDAVGFEVGVPLVAWVGSKDGVSLADDEGATVGFTVPSSLSGLEELGLSVVITAELELGLLDARSDPEELGLTVLDGDADDESYDDETDGEVVDVDEVDEGFGDDSPALEIDGAKVVDDEIDSVGIQVLMASLELEGAGDTDTCRKSRLNTIINLETIEYRVSISLFNI